MKKIALLLGIALAISASQAMAQTYRSELSTYGNYTRMKQSGQTNSISILDVGYGYYFTPQFVGIIDVARVSSNTIGYTDVGLGGKYYFGIGRRGGFVPYVDGLFGAEKTASYHDRRWQLGGGGSWFVSEATSFDVGLHWFRVSTEPQRTSGTIFGMGFTTRF